MFAGKAGLQVLLSRVGSFKGTNTLAYFAATTVTKKKVFMVLFPGVQASGKKTDF
jgi:hypothetical protein